MKFTKTLASVCAAAIAVSSLAVSAFAGSITFSDKVWWTQKDLKIEDILEGNKPEDVESITFTGDTAFLIGYNSTTVTDETKVAHGSRLRLLLTLLQLLMQFSLHRKSEETQFSPLSV